MVLEGVWVRFLKDEKFSHLLRRENFKSNRLLKSQFLKSLYSEDRKKSYQEIKALLTEQAYKNFLNCFRVYKARLNQSDTSITVSKESKATLKYLKTAYGFSCFDEVIDVISNDYKESNLVNHSLPVRK